MLPQELLVQVFHFLSHTELAQCEGVSWTFHAIVEHHYGRLWRSRLVKLKSSNAPAGRTCHSAVQWGDKMFSIGGMPYSTTISSVKKELCILDLKTWCWRTISELVPAVTEQRTVLWRDCIILFGGFYVEGRRSYLYVIKGLDQENPTIELIDKGEKPNAPPPRSSHSAEVYNDHMYVFGGWERVVPKNDLYSLDLRTMKWRCIHGNDNSVDETSNLLYAKPTPRRAHTSFLYKDEMFIFGGASRHQSQDVECRTDRINIFNLTTEQWSSKAVSGDVPCPRSRCDGVAHGNEFYLSGGWNHTEYIGHEIYQFQCDTLVWRRLKVNPLYGAVQHSVVQWRDKLLIFGGYQCNPPPPAETRQRSDSTTSTSSSVSSTSTSSSQRGSSGRTTNEIYLYQMRAGRG
eukprot:TRINITY_DN6604_c1_g4_i1.p1 TRINITY_DN6604_c1_g4~~TRINITY_DN6604_c1_g4_i1.p1  ORF type:complete len:402 (+),score=66.04 TRINITY_DN6604_c1_g4_i1:67-1272(+)